MMVAFNYDNGAVGSLYYSREIPSMLKGLRLSKLSGRKGVITFESNGVMLLARTEGRLPRVVVPLSRHSRLPGDVPGFPPRDRHRPRPEMNLERAMDDQRLRDQSIRPWIPDPDSGSRRAMSESFDIIIVGDGAGGGRWPASWRAAARRS